MRLANPLTQSAKERDSKRCLFLFLHCKTGGGASLKPTSRHSFVRGASEGPCGARFSCLYRKAISSVIFGVWWRKAPASEHGRALCGGDSGGRGGASRRRRAVVGEGFFGAARLEGAAVKAHPNLDFRWYPKSPHPGAGLLFRKKAKARAVLGLAEPVHPLPHLPRQSRLFGRHFRLHPPGGGRGILFEYRAADWNPALALRMRAIGAVRGAR